MADPELRQRKMSTGTFYDAKIKEMLKEPSEKPALKDLHWLSLGQFKD